METTFKLASRNGPSYSNVTNTNPSTTVNERSVLVAKRIFIILNKSLDCFWRERER